jgi:sigma-B regulation protein RsbU (phosphoserine phosphatase)
VTNRKKNGDLFWIEQTITPMKDRDGRITHFVSVLKDVTEARRAQDQEIRLRLARELQQRLYPTAPLAIPGFEIAGAAHPAHATGGDYFDFVSLRNGDLAVAIGDVSGHGFSAAIVMAETRAYLRALADTNSDPGEVLGTVNRALSADLENGQYVTLLLAVLDPHTRSLRYSSAGHLPTYVLDGEGATKAVLDSTGVPLGLFCGCQFRSGEAVNLAPGDIIVFLTDGVTEAQSLAHGEFGVQKALEVVAAHRRLSARELVGKVLEAVVEHTGNQPQLDDVSCVICKAVQ